MTIRELLPRHEPFRLPSYAPSLGLVHDALNRWPFELQRGLLLASAYRSHAREAQFRQLCVPLLLRSGVSADRPHALPHQERCGARRRQPASRVPFSQKEVGLFHALREAVSLSLPQPAYSQTRFAFLFRIAPRSSCAALPKACWFRSLRRCAALGSLPPSFQKGLLDELSRPGLCHATPRASWCAPSFPPPAAAFPQRSSSRTLAGSRAAWCFLILAHSSPRFSWWPDHEES